MGHCPSLVGCPFYNDKMADKPAIANLYKRKYCEKDYVNCARWKVGSTLGKQAVPLDLFPNQHERAEEIISQSKS